MIAFKGIYNSAPKYFKKMFSTKLAIITGAGSGIGRATCISLAKQGARVIAVDNNKEAANEVMQLLHGEEHSSFQMDVSKSNNIIKVIDDIIKIYRQPPSIVINCAGIIMDDFIVNMSENSFDKVVEVNLKGTFLVTQNFAKILIEHNLRGSIVNVGSIIGKIGNMGQCNYAASKAGVELITKTAAKEFGRSGIRCNVVLPGFIKTPMVESVPKKVKEFFAKQISLGRLGEAEEVAQVIMFLASDKSSYVNGASIEVTGGGL